MERDGEKLGIRIERETTSGRTEKNHEARKRANDNKK